MAAEKPSSDTRRKRLAAALKANIARRKAQARARSEAGAEDDNRDDPGNDIE